MELAQGVVEGDNDAPSVPLPPVLPPEIIWFQILPRLPAKSLMRFKCVCKSWSYLITHRNPSFCSVYQNFHCNLNTTHLLFKVEDKYARKQHFLSLQINQDGSPSPTTATTTHLLTLQPNENDCLPNTHCTNGLVCFSFGNDYPIRIFNPCTRECVTIPNASLTNYHSASPPTNHLSLDVEYCFGFSPLTNEYMVLQVQLCRFLHEEPAKLFRMAASINLLVFTLGTDSWRCIEVDQNDLPFDPAVWRIDKKSVCLHGAIHWIHEEEKCVLAFDLAEERFRVIPLPHAGDHIYSRHLYLTIADAGGCIALTYDNILMRNYSFGLWILKDYQNQVWVKEIIIPSCPLSIYPFSCLLPMHRGDVLLLSSSPVQVSLHFYNMQSKSFRTSSIILPELVCQNDARTRLGVLSSYDETICPLK